MLVYQGYPVLERLSQERKWLMTLENQLNQPEELRFVGRSSKHRLHWYFLTWSILDALFARGHADKTHHIYYMLTYAKKLDAFYANKRILVVC